MKRPLILVATHGGALALGFALGVYFLPILIAPPAPTAQEATSRAGPAMYTAEFRRDLRGSDFLHWGEGKVTIGRQGVALVGKLAPGPDYRLYFSPEFVDNPEDFLRVKPRMAQAGEVKTFENFLVPVPETIDPSGYSAVIVWCETFGKFITAAKYR